MGINKKYKYFFSHEFDENCFMLHHFQDSIDKGEYESIELFGAKLEVGGDGFFCNSACEVFERGMSVCGRMCDDYKPRNGKNGICVHHRNCYEITNDKFLLTENGLMEINNGKFKT